jgi:hypothetical protein
MTGANLAFWIMVFLGIVFASTMLGGTPAHDDSDPPNGYSRMTPLTDHLTGCQYLRSFGALTPRGAMQPARISASRR